MGEEWKWETICNDFFGSWASLTIHMKIPLVTCHPISRVPSIQIYLGVCTLCRDQLTFYFKEHVGTGTVLTLILVNLKILNKEIKIFLAFYHTALAYGWRHQNGIFCHWLHGSSRICSLNQCWIVLN